MARIASRFAGVLAAVAVALGVSEQTARARVSRAVAALRQSLPLNTQVESNERF